MFQANCSPVTWTTGRFARGGNVADPRGPQRDGETDQQNRFDHGHGDLRILRRVRRDARVVRHRIPRFPETDQAVDEESSPAHEQDEHEDVDPARSGCRFVRREPRRAAASRAIQSCSRSLLPGAPTIHSRGRCPRCASRACGDRERSRRTRPAPATMTSSTRMPSLVPSNHRGLLRPEADRAGEDVRTAADHHRRRHREDDEPL